MSVEPENPQALETIKHLRYALYNPANLELAKARRAILHFPEVGCYERERPVSLAQALGTGFHPDSTPTIRKPPCLRIFVCF
jgi:hypothetical protein